MKNCIQFNCIRLVLLLLTIYTTKASVSQNLYNKIETGQNVTGKTKAQFTARSAQGCSLRFVAF